MALTAAIKFQWCLAIFLFFFFGTFESRWNCVLTCTVRIANDFSIREEAALLLLWKHRFINLDDFFIIIRLFPCYFPSAQGACLTSDRNSWMMWKTIVRTKIVANTRIWKEKIRKAIITNLSNVFILSLIQANILKMGVAGLDCQFFKSRWKNTDRKD